MRRARSKSGNEDLIKFAAQLDTTRASSLKHFSPGKEPDRAVVLPRIATMKIVQGMPIRVLLNSTQATLASRKISRVDLCYTGSIISWNSSIKLPIWLWTNFILTWTICQKRSVLPIISPILLLTSRPIIFLGAGQSNAHIDSIPAWERKPCFYCDDTTDLAPLPAVEWLTSQTRWSGSGGSSWLTAHRLRLVPGHAAL